MKRWYVVLMLLLSPTTFAGEIYKWVDAEGRVHYGQTPALSEATGAQIMKVDNAATSATDADTCASWECYAQQLERQRHERERAYARRDAEQARIETDAKRQALARAAADTKATCERFPKAAMCKKGGEKSSKHVQPTAQKR